MIEAVQPNKRLLATCCGSPGSLLCAVQISRDIPHYHKRRWSQADLEALQHLGKQLRMYCAKIRTALAPIREAVSLRNDAACSPPERLDPQGPGKALSCLLRWPRSGLRGPV